MSEKPLHVRVAEALGWFDFQPSANGFWPLEWRGHPSRPIIGEPHKKIPRFDTDWSATGPLIERFGIFLRRYYGDRWFASPGQPLPGGADTVDAATPLEAVCNLILALHAAGKLEAA